jgi:hypothetical protein
MLPTGTTGVVLAAGAMPRLIIASLYLVGILLLGAVVIASVSRWRRRYSRERLTPGDQLTHFHSLYEKGAISAEEFARLRSLLTGQVLATAGIKKPPTGVTPEPSAPPAVNGQGSHEDGIRPPGP